MNKSQQILTFVILLAVLGLAVFGVVRLVGGTNGRGGTSNADEIILGSDLQTTTFVQAGSEFILGGAAGSGGSYATASMRSQRPSIGSCAGEATSTQFAIVNPYAATSTVEIQIVGVNHATSTLFQVGTSTSAFPTSSTSLSPTLINTTFSTSSKFAVWSGITVGSAGYPGSGSGTFTRLVVGPNDFVVGYATTSYNVASGAALGPTSCTYKAVWQN